VVLFLVCVSNKLNNQVFINLPDGKQIFNVDFSPDLMVVCAG